MTKNKELDKEVQETRDAKTRLESNMQDMKMQNEELKRLMLKQVCDMEVALEISRSCHCRESENWTWYETTVNRGKREEAVVNDGWAMVKCMNMLRMRNRNLIIHLTLSQPSSSSHLPIKHELPTKVEEQKLKIEELDKEVQATKDDKSRLESNMQDMKMQNEESKRRMEKEIRDVKAELEEGKKQHELDLKRQVFKW